MLISIEEPWHAQSKQSMGAERQHVCGRTMSKYRVTCAALRALVWIALAPLACINAGALQPPRPSHIFHHLVVGANGELLVAHTDGIFRKVAASSVWRRTFAKPGRLVDAGNQGIYLVSGDEFGDIFYSRDVGATWARTGTAAGLRHIGAHDGVLHGCAGRQIRMSRDGGKSWTPLATVNNEVGGVSGTGVNI